MKIARAKLFLFRRADGELVEMTVPSTWDQSLIPLVDREKYSVEVVLASKAPAEAAYGKVAVGNGPTAGYLIPGAAILSPENPHDRDATYCAYNMLIADVVCRASASNKYEAAGEDCQGATSRHQVFRHNAYYLITWNKYFESPLTFARDFALSLCDSGLVLSASNGHPTELYADYPGTGATLRLKSTQALPAYVITILGTLVPYCTNPFLRFFYLYQVVEYLMGIDFDSRVAGVRSQFLSTANPSPVELREILDKFQDATREKSRINAALVPACPTTGLSANGLLTALNALEPEATFAERIYRIRNILFHDYKQLHERSAQISELCRGFFEYLVTKKLLT